jgi:nucleoid DNA-binding protein
MNHTERVFQVARQVRGLTRDLAREAIERYLASAAQEMAEGEWVTLPSIGRVQIVSRRNGGRLLSKLANGQVSYREPGLRLQARVRMSDDFKGRCRAQMNNPAPDRPQSGKIIDFPVSARGQSGKER